MSVVLRITGVSVTYANRSRAAVSGVDLEIAEGECLALIGGSGSGKTTLARAALGLLPRGARVSGSIVVGDQQIVGAPERELRSLRGLVAGFVAQNPFAACHPLWRVADHVAEAWRAHYLAPPPPHAIVSEFEACGISRAAAAQYPHQWSGGMLQRAVIIAAAAHRPPLMIADEPTSALDAERTATTLKALRSATPRAAVWLISHDLDAVSNFADRVAVIEGGRIVECGRTSEIMNAPRHSLTARLLAARARTIAAPARAPSRRADARRGEAVIEARALSKTYDNYAASRWRGASSASPASSAHPVRALTRASLTARRGEIVGICGPSGGGKSTLLRLLATIEAPTAGELKLCGEIVWRGHRLVHPRARSGLVMPIFQDAARSLDALWPIWRSIVEPRRKIARGESRATRFEFARVCLAKVDMEAVDLAARPDELSVGQCQRVALVRALAAEPALLVADEPTSALDAYSAAIVWRLLAEAAEAKRMAIVVVSHDRASLEARCHRVLNLREGVLTDEGDETEWQ